MLSENAISDEAQDRLGFLDAAQHLAKAFQRNDLSNGFVIGVEGAWGSGKSSLVNMAFNILQNDNDGPIPIKFAPWLVGEREELLWGLFSEIEAAVVKQVPESDRDEIRKSFKRFEMISSGGAKIARIGKFLELPGAGKFESLLETMGELSGDLGGRTLSQANQEIRQNLQKIDRPIVVFIDDLDRLEPSETVEVLRLVRAVADFPNVAYILAYDREVVGDCIQRGLGIKDGQSYLEKVVQASFSVPKAMAFDLHSWLSEEFSKLWPYNTLSAKDAHRMDSTIAIWGRLYLRTPRDVRRILNAARLYVSPIINEIDPADAAFLQIIRVQDSKLFDLIEDYLGIIALASENVDKPINFDDIANRLQEHLTSRSFDVQGSFETQLNLHLPGILISKSNGKVGVQLAGYADTNEKLKLISDARLASPRHFRRYFAFGDVTGSIDNQSVLRFAESCDLTPMAAKDYFLGIMRQSRPQGGSLAELMIERLIELGDRLTPSQISALASVLSGTIHKLVPIQRRGHFGTSLLNGEKVSIFGLVDRLDQAQKSEVVVKVFKEACTLDWPTGIIQSQPKVGTDGQESNNTARVRFSADLLRKVETVYLGRLNQMSIDDYLRLEYPAHLLQQWARLEGVKNVSTFIHNAVANDDIRLLQFVSSAKSWLRDQHGHQPYINNELISELFPENTLEKINNMAYGLNKLPADKRKEASDTYGMIEIGDESNRNKKFPQLHSALEDRKGGHLAKSIYDIVDSRRGDLAWDRVAEKSGLSTATFDRWKIGKNPPTIASAISAFKAVGLTADEAEDKFKKLEAFTTKTA